jgi:enterochelin esterase-like enzyme
MLSAPSVASPVVDAAGVTFQLADPTGRLDAVHLEQELSLERGLDFARQAGVWRLTLARPPVDRMEYLIEVVDHNGKHMTILDPANPRQASGAFSAKSIIEFPEYCEPAWLAQSPVDSRELPLAIDPRAHGATITGVLWSPASLPATEPAPMLIVHDGPEYAALGSFTHYLGAMIADGKLPPLRAALLAPGDRNAWYSANPAYAQALCAEVVPELDRLAPATVRIGVGVSLGALAMLHAHRCYPATFAGLLLQSGSFFTPRLDPQERGFSGFGAVTAFVTAVADGADDHRPIPVAMTCGAPEENLGNNETMADVLTRLGYRVDFRVVRDAHNYIAWRDALDPALTELVTSVVGSHAP